MSLHQDQKPAASAFRASDHASDDQPKELEEGKAREPDSAPSPRAVHGVSWILVVIAIISSVLLYSLDNTIVANIVPAIVDDLGDAEKLPWMSVGFMLGALCATLPAGKLYGTFNTKWLYVLAIVLFMAGSALCGAAPNMTAMILGRVIAGVGGNGMYVGVVTLLSVNTTDKERPMYLGLIGLIYGLGAGPSHPAPISDSIARLLTAAAHCYTGTVIGPIIGGAFADSSATWRWGFYLNLVIGGVFAPVYLLLLPSFVPQPNASVSNRLREFDVLGSILQAPLLVCGIVAINFGGTLYAWGSSRIIALFVVAATLLLVFVVQQKLVVLTSLSNRLFPLQFVRMKEPMLLAVLMAANNAATFVLMYYLPLYFQFIKGVNPLESGVMLLPLIILITATIMLNGGWMSKTGHYQAWYVFGSVLVLVGGVLIYRIDLSTPNAAIYGYEVLIGIGLGCYLQSGYAVIQGVLGPSHMSYAVTFMLLAQILGVSLALSISGAIFVNSSFRGLQAILPDVPRQALQAALSGSSGGFFTTLPRTAQRQCLRVIMDSLQKVYTLVLVAGAVGLVASVFLSRKKINFAPPSGTI